MTIVNWLKKISLTTVGIASISFGIGNSAQAASLSNGSLNVNVNDSNGAINSVQFGGSEFYYRGTAISDFGFQVGSDISTFNVNTAFGDSGIPVSVSSNSDSIVATGTYTQGGSNILFKRIYSLIPGVNVLRTSMEFINQGGDIVLSAFDTFDPDQGIDKGNGFATYNDVYSLPTAAGIAKVAQATELGGLSVIIGSLATEATVASGYPFQIYSGYQLNNFFATPYDGNGEFADGGSHIGLRTLLAAGSSKTFVFDQAFGTSATNAQAAFIAANSTPVPEPASVLGLLSVGVLGATSLRRKQKVTVKG